MPKIIWCGNKSWDTNFPENTLPNNAKLIERPDNIFKSSMLYGILPLIFSYAIICIKWFIIGERAMNPIYVPLGIILGLLLMPVHEVLHGVCYKKGQKVYIVRRDLDDLPQDAPDVPKRHQRQQCAGGGKHPRKVAKDSVCPRVIQQTGQIGMLFQNGSSLIVFLVSRS